MKVVSFPLWGWQPKYVVGMIRNAELCPRFYPGWQCRVYAAPCVPRDALARLAVMPHVRVMEVPQEGNWAFNFWRGAPAGEAGVETAMFRDADCRFNERERRAVDAWLASQPFDADDRPEIVGPTTFERRLRSTGRRLLQAAGRRGPPFRF